ncbi:MAG TPA: serine hydrolase domain-containing protein [Vicinamibacteria bacterium]|nr:serine hydrolase domain-containing protein [Vicinamibacteria bacterium]
MTSRRALALLAAVVAAARGARAEGLAPAKAAAVEAAIADAMRAASIPGLTAAVRVGDVLWTRGFGEADVENHVPARPETLYRLASVSKPITAVAAMQLAEAGRLDLDADVRRYVPGFPKKPWPVTTRQLLSHLGGIRHYRGEEWDSTRRYVSVLEGLDLFKDDPLLHEPGTRFVYSTHGYSLAGAVIEAVSGRPFVEQLRDTVFAPAGLTTARDDDGRELLRERAQGYERTPDGRLRNSAPSDTSYKVPGGGLVATAPDVARFGAAFLEGRLVGTATATAMLAPQKTRDGRPVAYGLGWAVRAGGLPREAWHTGGQHRVSNVLLIRPDSGVVVVLLTNLEEAPGRIETARRIAEIVER